ncbi:ubiquitin carboxyl-terminal hydrolase [Tribonema minus]|uniref:Ubiquitin carboxyl-terminal hydrolase n=1 Tax=Tribonema minus TaxID=303371 RepID=A0A835YVG3_9STRA|nr:ubiquitin carboxyl-terminal hydrolase [Tribonema minus]
MADTWCTIESDPGVFTELIEQIGVKGVQVEELYSLDEGSFADLGDIYGLIFLFKWRKETDNRPTLDAMNLPDLFFSHQVIPNACATQAILSVLLNAGERVELGSTLGDFLAFSRDFPPDLKGLAISNSDTIRAVHNSYARQDPFLHEKDDDDDDKGKDAFHFIAYVPHRGRVYELDGLKQGPIELGEGADWLMVAAPAIQERIARYASSEIRFNLLALVQNKAEAAEAAIAKAEAEKAEVDAKVAGGDIDPDLEQLQNRLAAAIANSRAVLSAEQEKRKRWRAENARRKHNYVPFAIALLRALAARGALEGLAAKARERAETAAAAKQKRKAEAAELDKQ